MLSADWLSAFYMMVQEHGWGASAMAMWAASVVWYFRPGGLYKSQKDLIASQQKSITSQSRRISELEKLVTEIREQHYQDNEECRREMQKLEAKVQDVLHENLTLRITLEKHQGNSETGGEDESQSPAA